MSVQTFHYEGSAGKQLKGEIDPIIDIRDFKGTAGFPLLLLAAATKKHLSIEAVWHLLLGTSRQPGCERIRRSHSWLQRRRWLFLPPGASNLGNRDGKNQLAFQIMGEHPEGSLRELVAMLSGRGITRSKEWVRRHRGTPTVSHSP